MENSNLEDNSEVNIFMNMSKVWHLFIAMHVSMNALGAGLSLKFVCTALCVGLSNYLIKIA